MKNIHLQQLFVPFVTAHEPVGAYKSTTSKESVADVEVRLSEPVRVMLYVPAAAASVSIVPVYVLKLRVNDPVPRSPAS